MKTFIGLAGLGLSLMASTSLQAAPEGYFFGADMSFVNEMDDCGARFADAGTEKDAFQIIKDHGANLVRVRIWHSPDWTNYSNLADVKRTIRRAKALGMQTLLDFHYSDDWADGDKQAIPKAWANLGSVEAEAQAVHDYTLDVLNALKAEGLTPEMVQVGNETNGEIMRESIDTPNGPINWARNGALLNAGIRAVREAARDAGTPIGVMLHIAQPENVEPWFDAAAAAGVMDYDYIGISYYRKWSSQGFDGLGHVIGRVRHKYGAEVILVETAYPWTMTQDDTSTNVLGEDSLLKGYPASRKGQQKYMRDISSLVVENGGMGVVYWEPAWVSTQCKTRWGTGSAWENAAIFDYGKPHEALPAMDYLDGNYDYPVRVTFRLPEGAAADETVLTGDFVGAGIRARFKPGARGAEFTTRLMPGTKVEYRLEGAVVSEGSFTVGSRAQLVSVAFE
ncbi:MAG: arabinogalactan endo-1,4-beta-galactosidase [Alphaproteobacteria bacterium]|nr:MAG: arabinogalactan endo-1,4-beta-galactosidase [Alphaproteobacteria bacterium]